MKSPLQFNVQWRKMKRPGLVLEAPNPGLTEGDLSRRSHMTADVGHYTDSAPSGNREQDSNTWKSLGDLAKALAEKAGGAK